MKNNTLSCHYCGKKHWDAPIVEKPKRFGYKGDITFLAQTNSDNREVDNTCLECLREEIEAIKGES